MASGQIIKARRELLKLTREQLAKKVGVSGSYISFIERDRPVHFSDMLLIKISNALHLKAASLKPGQTRQNNKARKYYAARAA